MKITDAAMKKLRQNYETVRETIDYGNGRYVRKILEEAEMNLAERLLELEESEITTELAMTIEACDIPESGTGKLPAKKQIGFVC